MTKLKANRFNSWVLAAILVVCLLTCGGSVVWAEVDSSKYISVEEITTDMEAYCLTVVSGTEIRKFPLKIISSVKSFRNGRDAILVVGTDEVFKKVGAVQGCSGSPVYIDGRMAGALSAGYSFAKDPVYIVTPIAEMLEIPKWPTPLGKDIADARQLSIDYNSPIDLSAAYRQTQESIKTAAKNSQSQTRPMALTTSLPQDVCDELTDVFKPLGFVPVAAPAGQTIDSGSRSPGYAPGGTLALPLVSGDISLNAIGTITEVIDDQVYGFGHGFQSYGEVNFPMATGKIHMIIPSMQISFKVGQSHEISGTLKYDQTAGIVGKIGEDPKLIPVKVTVRSYNEIEPKVYNCKIAYNRLLSPTLIQSVILGAAQTKSSLPPNHTIKYTAKLNVQGQPTMTYEDVSSGTGYGEVLSGAVGMMSLFLNNPFEEILVEGLEIENARMRTALGRAGIE